ncbi:flavin reductase family protein [Thioclava sp. GXIMD4215]|uniref:flavin reductase family protein n=1 Tax=Thioclava sp. GXIMD4215 TaxID=3131928 RepID=UPI00324F0002
MQESDKIDAAIGAAQNKAALQSPDPADMRAFRAALGRFATGVTVVTARRDEPEAGPLGIVANSFASVSLDPPLVLWSPARASVRHAHFTAAKAFSIHVLHDAQADLILRFGRNGAGFDGLSYDLNAEDVPVLPDFHARFDCVTEAMHEGGDHTIIIGRVMRFATGSGTPMLFAHGAFGTFQKV